MNIQQLEYILAVHEYRHFANAAKTCGVTQPTLSMMIQKLEDELGVKIFDRSVHPVKPTEIGARVLEQARITLKHLNQISELIAIEQNQAKGVFQLGVIPTIAPFMVPELIKEKEAAYCDIELILKEKTTDSIISELADGWLDGGLMASPVNHPRLVEYPIYYEKFYAYVSPNDRLHQCETINLSKIDIDHIWLLENVHCMRGQIERLCRKRKNSSQTPAVKYEAGSIDTLINIVDMNHGMTIIPEMSAMGLSEERQENLRELEGVTAVREVSLVVNKEYLHRAILKAVIEIISSAVPKLMKNPDLKKFVVDL